MTCGLDIGLSLVIGLAIGLVIGGWFERVSRREIASTALDEAPDCPHCSASGNAVIAMDASGSAQLLLCHKGHIEHEISWHGPDIPGHYTYAGKRYIRHGRQGEAWEFRR